MSRIHKRGNIEFIHKPLNIGLLQQKHSNSQLVLFNSPFHKKSPLFARSAPLAPHIPFHNTQVTSGAVFLSFYIPSKALLPTQTNLLIMIIPYFTLLTSATVISLLPLLGYANPHKHGHGVRARSLLSTHNAEKHNHQCTTIKRRAW